VTARRWQSAHIWEGGFERNIEALAVGRAADGVELQLPVLDAKSIEQGGQHLEDLGIAGGGFATRGRGADDFGADLVELAVASLLRALAPELGPDVVELVEAAVPELVFDVGAHDAGGVFGAEREGLTLVRFRPTTVVPGVHLFRDDVGFLAYSTGEELRRFKNRRADFLEVVRAHHLAHFCLDEVPQPGIGREQVSSSADGLDHEVSSQFVRAICVRLSAKHMFVDHFAEG